MRSRGLILALLVLVACGEDHERADASVATDAARGSDARASTCDDALGSSCEGSSACDGELECQNGRCVVARAGCGGFAGAPCDGELECVYFESTDFGVCVTTAERGCLCERAPSSFSGCE
ncbi:hypothetical protein [Sandaracinus amylolyticus]|uniref:Lipoprotein n=1 Tax=Sandaracinus amylolyticus TaxID=927083 RepID=A0A0F6YFG0_9BACT|nr:hypothetical protein [Sandaracinus amylolyticus]AKF03616.1 hypothetical protein DB32_000765 [Sandaracinus amylolyticus]